MKMLLRVSLIVALVGLFSGCSNTSLIADVDPAADLSKLRTFYVAKLPADGRDIHLLIAARLNQMGKTASAGVAEKPDDSVDAIVTYQDKWMWDITMYMLELNVDIRDPATNYKFATGKTYRTSLARKSPDEMVEEVLNKIFEGQ